MGVALDSILGTATLAAGGTFEPLTPGAADVFTIRDYVKNTHAYLLEAWAVDDTSPCRFSIASPRMNDSQLGLQLSLPSGAAIGPADEPQVIFPGPVQVPVYNADQLRVSANGVTGDKVALSFLLYYEDLDGSDAKYSSWLQIVNQIEKVFGILVQPTSGALDYGSGAALDSVDDRLEADKKYALLGMTTDTPLAQIGITGPDTGRYRVSMPGKVDPTIGGDWFVQLSAKYNLPLIPVIKANNAGSTLIDCVDTAGGATPNITLILAQLAG
jgi:hypothetical protein